MSTAIIELRRAIVQNISAFTWERLQRAYYTAVRNGVSVDVSRTDGREVFHVQLPDGDRPVIRIPVESEKPVDSVMSLIEDELDPDRRSANPELELLAKRALELLDFEAAP